MKGTHFKRLTACAAALVLAAAAIPEGFAALAANSVTYTAYSWNETEKKLESTEKTITSCNEVSSYIDMFGETFTGTYYIKKDVLISRRISVAKGGTLNLIVPKGVTLTLTKGLGCGYGKKDSTPTTLNIYGGGKIIATGEDKCAGIGGKDDEANGIINIHGTTIEATGGKHGAGIGGGEGGQDPDEKGEKSRITIYAGEISANGGIDGAGIGGGDEQPGARTYIYSGKIGAGSAKHGAGIGGGDEEGTYGIHIYDGKITATGGEGGAGIGAGEEGGNLRQKDNGGGINIYGGEITAKGGGISEKDNVHAGAGIGGGWDEDMSGTIFISGDTTKLTAQGGIGAAGIGAGRGEWPFPNGDMKGEITIKCGDNSDLIIIGGSGGAGIGAGFQGNMQGKAYINGGKIKITSGYEAAGIGGGREGTFDEGGEGGTVYIGGGDITIDLLSNDPQLADSHAIGRGALDEKTGTLYISKDNNKTGKCMRVDYRLFREKEGWSGTAKAGSRTDKCHAENDVHITECNHKDVNGKSGMTYTIVGDQHRKKCKYCGLDVTEDHKGADCECGYQSGTCTVYLRSDSGTEAGSVARGKQFELPDYAGEVMRDNSQPTQYSRVTGWTLDGDTSGKVYEQGELVTVNGDMKFYTVTEPLYQISFDAIQNGSIHAGFDGNETYAAEGEELVFGVEPEAGFSVNRVSYQVMTDYSIDDKGNAVPKYSDPIELQPQENGTYALTIPELEIPNNLIKISAETVQDVNHTVGISSAFGGTVTADLETAEENDTVTLTVTPEAGFQLEKIRCRKSEGDVELTKVNDTTYTFKMPAEDVTVSAEFEYQPLMSITADSSKYYMNVFLPIADGKTVSDYSAVFGDDVQELTSAKLNGQACGKFTIQCAAKEMVDTAQLTIQIGEETAYSGMLSAEKYLKALADDETYGNNAKAMLRYGAAAQTYFDYKTDCLANDGVEGYGLDSLEETEIANNSPSVEEYRDAFALSCSKYAGMNMTFDSDTSLLIAFEIKGGDAEAAQNELEEKFENTAYEVTFETDNSGDFIIVKAANIPIKKLGDAIFAFSGVSVKADDYLARIANNSEKSENLRNLCRALYAFYESAK